MKKSKWLVMTAALGMMAMTGLYLSKVHQSIRLGAPGVRVGPGLLYNETNLLVARQCVVLPEEVLGMKGANLPVTQVEIETLPKDTTFGRKEYLGRNNFNVETSVVLMGTDRTSIHQPQYCLDAQGWHRDKTDLVRLTMDRPYSNEVQALKLTVSKMVLGEFKQPIVMRGFYVYWFVTADKITPSEGMRMWSLAKTMVEKRELERWAYIAYFVTCLPGQEGATFEKLERFIRASAPEFQTVTGPPSAGHLPVAAR